MIYNRIEDAIGYAKQYNVDDIIERNDIELRYMSLESAYGIILIGDTTTIFVDDSLPWQCREFVLWHEIGHFLMDGKGEYHFNKKGRNELKTNIFACLMVGNNANEWIMNGCPEKVAYNVYDYVSQNVHIRERLSDVYF